MTKIASFDDILGAKEGTKYDTVEAHGVTFRLGSVSSKDMLQWIEENDDKEKQKVAGFRLLVKCIVDAEGNRIPEERHEEFIEALRQKDASNNAKLVDAALRLNGLRKEKQVKNDSSEAGTGASPSDSQPS